jgi:uridine phosphorylase
MQPEVRAGSIVVASAACREEGVTEKMIPLSYPAVADTDVVNALMKSAGEHGIPVQKGMILTQALFYPGLLESKVKLYAKAGVKAMENEAAGLFVTAALNGVKAGVIVAADAPAFELVGPEGYEPDQAVVLQAIEDEIRIAFDAIIRL